MRGTWLLVLATACGGDSNLDPELDDAAPGTPDAGAPDAGAPDADPGPARLTAPALVSIDCGGLAIPADGKIDCTTTIAYPDGTSVYAGGVGVGLRGRSSQGFPKKQYAIELRNPDGSDADVDLFGMGADADWILNGMFIDRGLLRNRLAYDLYRAMGRVAPESAYAELTLDGAYLGVFALCERIERGAERVDIPPDDGTGASFIVKGSEDGYASGVQAKSWEVVYPKVPPPGIATRLAAAENAILEPDGDPFSQLDRGEFIDFVILEETLKNNDAYFLSHHVYTRADGKLGFIPWDLDLTLGQPSYNDNELADRWILYRPTLIAGPASQPGLREALAARWTELRAGLLGTEALVARIAALRAEIGDAWVRNVAVWPVADIPNQTWFPLYPAADVDEEFTKIEAFVRARLAWIDGAIATY